MCNKETNKNFKKIMTSLMLVINEVKDTENENKFLINSNKKNFPSQKSYMSSSIRRVIKRFFDKVVIVTGKYLKIINYSRFYNQ